MSALSILSLLSAGAFAAGKDSGQKHYTVKQIWAQKDRLKGKKVSVKGKVVKFNEGIMGKNWLHIQDGTGGKGENDLTLVTDQPAQVGQNVLATCTVSTDKDFGAGYFYKVILENCRLQPVK